MIAVIADLLALFVVPSFLVGLAAVVLWCARRDFRRDARHPRRGGRWSSPQAAGGRPVNPDETGTYRAVLHAR